MSRIRLSALAVVAASLALLATACITPTANQAPIAVANATPTSGTAPLSVVFSSAGSHDQDATGSIAAYSWAFGDGSPLSSDADPTHIYATDGVFNAVLTVTDRAGAHGRATQVITVAGLSNQSPVAQIGATPASGDAPLSVVFSSTGSHDPDGSIASYAWDFGDGGTSTDPSPTHVYTAAGTEVATLTVKDNSGATNSASTTITVGANVAPTAAAGATPQNGKAPLTVDFTSSGSADSDGTIASYAWDFGDGGTSSDPNPTHVYSSVNVFTATLTVTDNGGATGTATIPVTVVANQAPIAQAGATPSTGRAPLDVTFSSTGSHDPDGSIVSYSWTFGDGGTSTDPNPTHTFAAGTYNAELTVTDDSGATATSDVAIDATLNTLPTAVANSDATTGVAPATINFDASGSTDPDGSISTYAWNFGDSTTGSGETVSHSYATAGTYAVTLTVTDNEGAQGSDTHLSITVTNDTAGRYVATTGSDSSDCSSSTNPCLTVNYAVSQASPGDTVHIAAGNYPEMVEVSKNLVFKGPNAGVDGTSASRGPEAVVKGFSNAYAGSITNVSSTTYSGTITNASDTTAISNVTGGGNLTYASGAGAITAITNTNPIVYTTALSHELNTGDTVTVSGVVGETAANFTSLPVTVIDATHFSVAKAGNGTATAFGAYKSGPVILTTNLSVPFSVGSSQSLVIAGLAGNSAANGTRTVTVLDSTHLSVTGVVANGTYTSGGTYASPAIVTTATPHGLATGAKVTITGVVGSTGVNSANKVVTVIDATHFSMAGVNAAGDYTSGGTVTTPNIVFTTGEPITLPYSAGLTATVSGVGGNTSANATKAVTVLDPTHFTFTSTVAPTGTYTAGGTYTSSPMIVTTGSPQTLTGNFALMVQGVNGDTAANSTSWTASALDSTHLLLSGGVSNAPYSGGGRFGEPLGGTITGASNASPIVITTAGPNGLSTGQTVGVSGVTANTGANGSWPVTVIDGNHFSLDGSTGTGAGTTGTFTGALLTSEVNGVEVSPQGDAAYIGVSGYPLVNLFGGPQITVQDSVFNGGPYNGGCDYTCTTMTDAAFQVESGATNFSHNLVTNFRRPLAIGMTSAAFPTTTVSLDSNTFSDVTSRALAISEGTGLSTMPPVSVTNNTFTTSGLSGASSPGAIIISDNANVISTNSFSGYSSGVFIDVCKKFSTENNSITGNTFTSNSYGVYINDDTVFGGQCQTGTVGGDITGTVASANNFVGNGVGLGGSFSTAAVDATCSWWGAASGPNTPGADTASGGAITTPWAVASQPGGTCTGS